MRLLGECMLLVVGLGVFWFQHRIKEKISKVASKLIFWSALLFLSIGINTLLFNDYGQYYKLLHYVNENTIMLAIGVVLLCIILQVISPFKPFKKGMDYFKRKKERKSEENLNTLGDDKLVNIEIQECHFEVFLETICFLSITVIFLIEIAFYGLSKTMLEFKELMGLREIGCLMMILTLPIAIRQLMYYLYMVSTKRKEEVESEFELRKAFRQKLKKQHTKF